MFGKRLQLEEMQNQEAQRCKNLSTYLKNITGQITQVQLNETPELSPPFVDEIQVSQLLKYDFDKHDFIEGTRDFINQFIYPPSFLKTAI